jgi:NAD-dependent dihydropyrimidine dehydrogenase PreA subunit
LSRSLTKSGSRDLSFALSYLLPLISILVLAAHFLRSGSPGIFYSLSVCSIFLFLNRSWLNFLLSIILFAGAVVWCTTAYEIAAGRMEAGLPYIRAMIIIGIVALIDLASAYILIRKSDFKMSAVFFLPVLTFFLTLGLLALAVAKNPKMMLMGRFFNGGVQLQIFLASIFGGFVATKLWDLKEHPKWRLRLWLLFSIFFYVQLLLGLFGAEIFLQTGKLHVPVPAMVIAGPIFRGEGFFMPILFMATILFVGPAWCSHFCYFGAWDNLASSIKKKPDEKPGFFSWARIFSLLIIVGASFLLKFAGVSMGFATALGVSFGILSISIIAAYSRRKGLMVNCTALCPLGLLANTVGKISPFRIKIETTCVDCMACFKVCRYGALQRSDIEKRRAGFTCSLCGDCVISCPKSSIHYSFVKLSQSASRFIFVLFSSTLYSAFFAIAMV